MPAHVERKMRFSKTMEVDIFKRYLSTSTSFIVHLMRILNCKAISQPKPMVPGYMSLDAVDLDQMSYEYRHQVSRFEKSNGKKYGTQIWAAKARTTVKLNIMFFK